MYCHRVVESPTRTTRRATMLSVKLYLPKQLLKQQISEQDIQDWHNKLEIRLGADEDMARFMSEGRYHTWQSEEQYLQRILQVHVNNPDHPEQPDQSDRPDHFD